MHTTAYKPHCRQALGITRTWWRHQMETFSALLALCMGNSPVTGEFPEQRLVTRSFDFFILSKQSWCWWFETPSRSLWRHCNEYTLIRQLFYHIWGYHIVELVAIKLWLGNCFTISESIQHTWSIHYINVQNSHRGYMRSTQFVRDVHGASFKTLYHLPMGWVNHTSNRGGRKWKYILHHQ